MPSQKPAGSGLPHRLLIILLAVSLLTNVILLVRLKQPAVWSRVLVALTSAPEILPADHLRGNPAAKHTIIVYTDFQCPFCAELHSSLKKLAQEADVRWAYRHFPIKRHQLAASAAEAAECAADQGTFWEYADALFERQASLSEDALTRAAGRLGMNMVSFGLCRLSGEKRAVVEADRRDGEKKRVAVTPTFYVDGKRFDGLLSYEELEKLVGR